MAAAAPLLFVGPASALAGCATVGGITTCTGDVSSGVSETAPSTTTLNVNSLTTNIDPSSGTIGIELTSQGSNGHKGDNGTVTDPPGSAGKGEAGDDIVIDYVQPGADAVVGSSGAITTSNAEGIFASSRGGRGGNGGDGDGVHNGTDGDTGGAGGNVTVHVQGAISVSGDQAPGVVAASIAGKGGNGGDGALKSPGDAGKGGAAGSAVIEADGTIKTSGSESDGLHALSRGGAAGDSGDCALPPCGSPSGANAADGGLVHITTTTATSIVTTGNTSNGIFAQSVGGAAGDEGTTFYLGYYKSSSASAGDGGNVIVDNAGSITTGGSDSFGIYAQSVGGGGGKGANSLGISSLGGQGSKGGNGGTVTVTNSGAIVTTGGNSIGIFGQSIGGAGGDGGSARGLLSSVGGNGADTSDAGAVTITNTGSISTGGHDAQGIFAQSVGGGGGNGGGSNGLLSSLGGSGGGGGDGAAVTVNNGGTITTVGKNAQGILAQSIGGGGGNGGDSAAAAFSIGGSGENGGDGKTVTITHSGGIVTQGRYAQGILAQSIGGGGGNGGDSLGSSLSIGGSGDGGGNAGAVAVTLSGSVETFGKDAAAVLAQSIGGGGGNGGNSVAAGSSVAVAMGGAGARGGDAGEVRILRDGSNTPYAIVTHNDRSTGVSAQSIGGGGGNGGFAASASAGLNFAASAALGGTGGPGGKGGNVTAETAGTIATSGDYATGLFAQSVGGGGGNGGFAVSASASLGVNASLALGADGGDGGDAGTVNVSNLSTIATAGNHSSGIVAQSVGGGGGNGGFAVSGGGSALFSATLALGGAGGSGGLGAAVQVDSTGSIVTAGNHAIGIFAQSVGGGGGNGGFSVSGSFSGGGAISMALGGSGGGGQSGSTVVVNSTGNIETAGNGSVGIFAQSVGGGGGNGGFAASGAFAQSGTLSLALGGNGGAGASANSVHVTSDGTIVTHGNHASGIIAQSVGGGGGNGGFSLSATASEGASAGLSIGGSGGNGSIGNAVTVDMTGGIFTEGAFSHGIFAQSVGGGGGNGGFSISGTLTTGPGGASISLGGSGGTGQTSDTVTVNSNVGAILSGNIATIATQGKGAYGIYAQSVGGGGGSGGFSGSLAVGLGASKGTASLSLGGSGSGGGDASAVSVTSVDNILTTAKGAGGIFAQSIGGGGGDGGFSLSAALTTEEKGAAVSTSFGGSGAAGGKGSAVNVDSTGIIQTGGDNASAILAQSVGGGGGNGGFSASGSIGAGTGATQFSVSLGGTGGGGGDADDVSVVRNGSIVTAGEKSYGIFAQSVGGGGGNGGLSFSGAFGGVDSKNFTASIGGSGGNGGDAGNVTVNSTGSIATSGLSANAIFAQSIGKGGGNGGLAISGAFGVSGEGTNLNVGLTVGGSGGGGGIGRAVNVTSNGTLSTAGDGASAIFAQSIGGGGGNGGMAVGGLLAFYDPPGGGTTPGNIVNASVTVGGVGGTGNVGGNVFVEQSGAVTTTGLESYGIFAQSLGGGGGTGGQANALSYVLGQKCPTSKIGCTPPPPGTTPAKNSNIRIVVGGEGGSGNHGGDVTVINHGSIVTTGDFSDAIFAQSVGAGGGSGGNGVIGYSGLAPADDIPVGAGLILSVFNTASFVRSPSVTVGGSAGASGDGHTVTVTNAGAITTLGNDTFAILAQSVGGGGGKGGQAIAGLTGTIGVGGSGGSGGNGGDVTVTNAAGATIVARGTISAAGILAQSTGGGGGIAGASSGIVGIGGAGASAGDGGAVTVTNNAGILTTGINSWGVAALSTGGGGGIGGSSLLSGLAIGGSGGSSGKGGDITVSNTGIIITGGNSSQGILAQSVGGGGGVGGSGIGGVILGGTGGSTGDGGHVGVTNTGAIVTVGIASHGVLAQSIGGGGGVGGGGSGLLTLGGNGTGGGNGGAVDLVNSGSIDTSGDLAIGLFAQSIGGGGGIGGAGASVTELLNIEDPALGDVTTVPLGDPKFSTILLGGDGAGGGNGGAVTVTNNAGGMIVTRGAYAHGVFGQSVGGGGGLGGSGDGAVTYGGNGGGGGDGGAVMLANNGAVTTLGEGAIGVFGQSIGGGGGSGRNRGVGASTFGGSNGATGNGGTVSITNYVGGIIDTLGEFAHGLFAQSIGGGGGSSGSGSGALTLGGDGSNGGDGGQVAADNRDTIITRGANAIGLFAQSIGGGGGAAGADGTGAVTLGGGSGNGGVVGIANSGSITTLGDGSHALFAQSIGGGGGYVFAGAGHPLGFAAGNGSGNGAAVTITNSGDLTTYGVSAHGIFAQSIGGGGGAGGNGPYASSVGTASGFAGSTGSPGTAGDVTITYTGHISAQGVDSFGILAQSKGATGNGNLTLALNGGTIVGGSGSGAGLGLLDGATNLVTNHAVVASASLADGYAVRATGGDDTIDNFGTMIGSVDLGAGLNSFTNRAGAAFMPGAVVALGAGNTLTNDGMISPGGLGHVMTTTIIGKFVQSSTGLYAVDIDFAPNKADRIDVTETSSLAGTLAINAVNFGNAATGHHEVTIASAKGGSKGTLTLDAPASAIATYQLIYPNDTDVVLAYDINYQPTGLPQQLSSITDAINRIQAAGSTPDFSRIAAALFALPDTESLTKALQMLGGEGSAVTQQVAMGTTGQFTSALGDRGGTWFNGSHDANSVSYLDANASMMSYAPRRKRRHHTTAFDRVKLVPAAVQPDRWRAWTNVFGGRRTVDGNASGTLAGMTQTTYGGMFGVDRQMNQDFLLGVAVGASSGSFNVADRATQGSVDGAQFGAYGMTRRGAWYVFGSLGYTRFANRTSRTVAGVGPTEIARGSFASDQLSGRVEVGRKSDFGRFAVTPFAALEFARLWQHAYSESTTVTSTGAPGILGLTYEAQSITSVPASLGLQIDSQFTLANRMTVTPFARAAWVHEFEADRRIVPSFNAAPGYTFVTPAVSAAVDVARFNVGATLGVTEHASFFAGFSGDFASNMESYGVTGGYRVGW